MCGMLGIKDNIFDQESWSRPAALLPRYVDARNLTSRSALVLS